MPRPYAYLWGHTTIIDTEGLGSSIGTRASLTIADGAESWKMMQIGFKLEHKTNGATRTQISDESEEANLDAENFVF